MICSNKSVISTVYPLLDAHLNITLGSVTTSRALLFQAVPYLRR